MNIKACIDRVKYLNFLNHSKNDLRQLKQDNISVTDGQLLHDLYSIPDWGVSESYAYCLWTRPSRILQVKRMLFPEASLPQLKVTTYIHLIPKHAAYFHTCICLIWSCDKQRAGSVILLSLRRCQYRLSCGMLGGAVWDTASMIRVQQPRRQSIEGQMYIFTSTIAILQVLMSQNGGTS